MTTNNLDAAAEALSIFGNPSPEEVNLCLSEIVPAVRSLVDRGVSASAIIEALASASAVTCGPASVYLVDL